MSRSTLILFAVAGTQAVVAVVSFEVMFLTGLSLSWFGSVLAGSSAANYRRVTKAKKHVSSRNA